jgi:hypothetical protein
MAEDPATAKRAGAISTGAARLSFAAAATFVVLLAALHFIKPGLDPSWHFISEYAIGDYGWIMVLAFLSLALGYVTLFVAIRSQLRTVVGRVGLALLLVSALGLTIAAVFTTDPITVSKDAATTEGTLHNLGGTLGLAMPFAAALIGWKLARNPAWSSAKRPLLGDRPGPGILCGVLRIRGLYGLAKRRRIRPGRVGRMAQPHRDSGLQRVADGGVLASDPGE